MNDTREPLLWIALASLFAFLPQPVVALPVCATLLLGAREFASTPAGRLALPGLLVAQLALAAVAVLHVLGFTEIAAVGMPLALCSLGLALALAARGAALDTAAAWLCGACALLLAWILVGREGALFGALACPTFALQVVRLRAAAAIPDAR